METKTLNVRSKAFEQFSLLCKKEKRKAIDQFEVILESYSKEVPPAR